MPVLLAVFIMTRADHDFTRLLNSKYASPELSRSPTSKIDRRTVTPGRSECDQESGHRGGGPGFGAELVWRLFGQERRWSADPMPSGCVGGRRWRVRRKRGRPVNRVISRGLRRRYCPGRDRRRRRGPADAGRRAAPEFRASGESRSRTWERARARGSAASWAAG